MPPRDSTQATRLRFPEWPPRGGMPQKLNRALRLHTEGMFICNDGMDYTCLTYQAFKDTDVFVQHMAATAAKYKAEPGAVATKYQRSVN